MITFNYETNFSLSNESQLSQWVEDCIIKNDFKLGEINYIFCDDAYLHSLNVKFLNHDTFTDIISFDNTVGRIVSGDIFISVDRVKENANDFKVSFDNELHRVMIHGVLHYLGFKDKTAEEKSLMRGKEDECITLLNN
ncbi:MAG: rRNA maturation RNase YbeY [Flavobacteriaceae bacterium]|nr:rRNA maturation RNase YbeY [Flavobacteriaceae bacterium]